LVIPAIVSALMDDTATVSTAVSPTPPHFRKLFLTRQAWKPDKVSNVATASNATKPMIFCMLLLNELSAGKNGWCAGKPARRFGWRMTAAPANLAIDRRQNYDALTDDALQELSVQNYQAISACAL
jgi:hypothetical protein